MSLKGLHRLIETRIQEAQARGELENLPGKGRELQDDGLSSLPEEQRTEALLLRITGAPEEVSLLRDLAELRERFDRAATEDERRKVREELRTKAVRLSLLFERTSKFLSARKALEMIP
jgi:hypothetical protein